MGQVSKKAVDRLHVIGSGQSPALRELDETRANFRFRLNTVLSNLPEGEIIEVPSAELGPGDLAAQESQATH